MFLKRVSNINGLKPKKKKINFKMKTSVIPQPKSSRVYLTQGQLQSMTAERWGQSSSVGDINLSSIGVALNPELQTLMTATIAILHDTNLVSENILFKSCFSSSVQ